MSDRQTAIEDAKFNARGMLDMAQFVDDALDNDDFDEAIRALDELFVHAERLQKTLEDLA